VSWRSVSQHSVERPTPHVCLHDHARPATEGRVVDGVMHVSRPGAQIVHAKIDVPARPGLTDQRNAERPRASDAGHAGQAKVVGENSNDVDPHA
jgi:hypothetical protein